MRIQEYSAFDFTLTFTLETPRPESAPASVLVAAGIHEEWVSKCRAALREFKHVAPTDAQVPAALSLGNYLPGGRTAPLYVIRTLAPAGSIRDVDREFWTDITRVRYSGLLCLLPAALSADERSGFAFERHLEKAVLDLFTALSLPVTFIPGDDETRPEDRTVISLVAEIGPAALAPGRFDVPTPSAP